MTRTQDPTALFQRGLTQLLEAGRKQHAYGAHCDETRCTHQIKLPHHFPLTH